MVGKASLFLILGFSLIFLVLGNNFGRISVQAFNNFSEYHDQTVAHDIAISGANIGIDSFFRDTSWNSGLTNADYQGGKLNLSIAPNDSIPRYRVITSVGIYYHDTATIQVTLRPGSFAEFAYYSVNEGGSIRWITQDSVWGPFHTQDKLLVDGRPYFDQSVSTLKGIDTLSGGPVINGTYTPNVDTPMDTGGVSNVKAEAANDGYTFTGHDTVYLSFVNDSVKYKYSYNGPVTSKLGTQLAPNGVIFADQATLRIQGTVQGQYTVGASQGTKTVTNTTYEWQYVKHVGWTQVPVTTTSTVNAGGNIYIDDNITYKTNPKTNPSSNDLLGIVAENNVEITKNYANNHDVIIDAAIYCQNGGLTAEDYGSRPVSGAIYLLGGLSQNLRGAVGTYSGSTIAHGFRKYYMYDGRLKNISPPAYPETNQFQIIAWYERSSIHKQE